MLITLKTRAAKLLAAQLLTATEVLAAGARDVAGSGPDLAMLVLPGLGVAALVLARRAARISGGT